MDQEYIALEEELFEALEKVLMLDPKIALSAFMFTVSHIATFLADIGAISHNSEEVELARSRIALIRQELEDLDRHLCEFDTTNKAIH